MQLQEFNHLAAEQGFGDVDAETYGNTIEPVYMATDLDKETIVKLWHGDGNGRRPVFDALSKLLKRGVSDAMELKLARKRLEAIREQAAAMDKAMVLLGRVEKCVMDLCP